MTRIRALAARAVFRVSIVCSASAARRCVRRSRSQRDDQEHQQ